jgi:non-ribosomal peptide synthetase component F
VLKTGAAYVPVDPSFPKERIDFILSDTNASLLLTQKHLLDQNDKLHGINTLTVDLEAELYTRFPIEPVPHNATADNLAYVIYTSGTTGKPKGVMIEHKSVVNLIINQTEAFGITSKSKSALFSTYTFDASVSEIFTTILSNAELHIIPDFLRRDPIQLSEYIASRKINVITLPPALLTTMPFDNYPDLETLVVAGESTSLEAMKQWAHNRRLINAYGPTENTVCASLHHYTPGDLNTNIGKPLNNVRTYILDEHNIPLPIGVTGELHIG